MRELRYNNGFYQIYESESGYISEKYMYDDTWLHQRKNYVAYFKSKHDAEEKRKIRRKKLERIFNS